MHCFNASPWPWKNKNDRKKSAMKMRTREMTTALVVDSPTPFAPPVVVNPQAQLTCRNNNGSALHRSSDHSQYPQLTDTNSIAQTHWSSGRIAAARLGKGMGPFFTSTRLASNQLEITHLTLLWSMCHSSRCHGSSKQLR